ncbi:MAG: UDP-N-acetylglucosamine 2-epimerase (non-hydrolyzing) [Saprospiraceae bacterium]|nr:UDP-N-acetylglucosamine 2-epimerase (non-hydrolyzing) [Saprospiraceae bacterium]
MKILTVVGARPQFVKAAVVSRNMALQDGIQEFILHSGQHYDDNMSAIFFEEMRIPTPHFNLNINGGHHGEMTGKMMAGIEQKILEIKPDALLVYGDTNSTLAGALAAAKLHVPVIHVEAGLRSFNMRMPEEINRILTDRISQILFCPTTRAVENLQREGFDLLDNRVELVGDVMQDAALFYAADAASMAKVFHTLELETGSFLLVTCHRAENTNDPERFGQILQALNELAERQTIIFPVHPRTRQLFKTQSIHSNLKLIDPVGYFDMILLLKNCQLVITDSGGLQKEAYFFQKHCITMRDETEWVELVDGGYNVICGADARRILTAFEQFQTAQFKPGADLYGGGQAGERIVSFLMDWL